MERSCARCNKTGIGFPKCSRCKEVFYCDQDCQKLHWLKHKPDCQKPEDRPKVDEDIVVGYVECESFENCRDYLQKHPELINKDVSDEMYQKAYLALKSHPPVIGTRFIRNAQILQYLLDLRKISGGQQDVTLFFARILNELNPEYRNSFTEEYTTLVKRILTRLKEKEQKAKEEENKSKEEEKK